MRQRGAYVLVVVALAASAFLLLRGRLVVGTAFASLAVVLLATVHASAHGRAAIALGFAASVAVSAELIAGASLDITYSSWMPVWSVIPTLVLSASLILVAALIGIVHLVRLITPTDDN